MFKRTAAHHESWQPQLPLRRPTVIRNFQFEKPLNSGTAIRPAAHRGHGLKVASNPTRVEVGFSPGSGFANDLRERRSSSTQSVLLFKSATGLKGNLPPPFGVREQVS